MAGPIWPSSFPSPDFALPEVICSSGNGSIVSSDSLLKCLPRILRAIQSNPGLAFASWRLQLHTFLLLAGYSERHLQAEKRITDKTTTKMLLLSHFTACAHIAVGWESTIWQTLLTYECVKREYRLIPAQTPIAQQPAKPVLSCGTKLSH